jgi:glycosyltransferase involved in cell wall biosynthesis
MILPDLTEYLRAFKENGITYPLPVVKRAAAGLLNELPAPPPGRTGWPWTEQAPCLFDNGIEWPKLTIVTPSYNQSQYLEETVRSILLQNYPNLEYIVIDGGSNDGSMDILEKYSPWISYWQCEKDRGQAHAINMGFSLGTGTYLAWINSDDYYLKDVFYAVVSTFMKHSADFVYGYAWSIKEGEAEPVMVTVPPLSDYFIKIPTLAQPACFWSARIHQPVWEEMICALDYELWLRLVKGHKRTRLKKVLAAAHVHSEAKTANPKMQSLWHEDHVKMWSEDGHGPVPEWKRIVLFNRIRLKLYKLLRII